MAATSLLLRRCRPLLIRSCARYYSSFSARTRLSSASSNVAHYSVRQSFPPKTTPLTMSEEDMVARDHRTLISLDSISTLLKTKSRTILRFGIVGVGLYGLYWFTSSVTDFWIGFTLWDMGEAGFLLGSISSLGLLASTYAISRRFGIRSPKRACEYTLQRLQRDETLRLKIGDNIQLGELQAHAYTGGFQKRKAWKNLPYYTWTASRRLQLIFAVNGHMAEESNKAIVSCDITRRARGEYVYRSLVVDLDKTSERLVYEGDEKSALFRTLLKAR